MAIIINRTKFALSITGPGIGRDGTVNEATQADAAAFSRTISPGETDASIPDDVAKHWMTRADEMVRSGNVIVKLGQGEPAAPAPAVRQSVISPPLPPAEEPDDATAFAALHWRSAKAIVAKMTDLDDLEKLHAVEERDSVRTCIEARMKDLMNG